ncbi:Arginase/deacetylase [Cristinia sonorae]|uniref:Arginase/deacetylase n=1 Tax=Cristinia sonorae TaxID=1940300 RepID=A0A8K0XPH6_9AGAR|nr:Arginase/deacetylase [Cristinia sonorae]
MNLTTPFTVYIQQACLRHQFIRSKDTSTIVERPERLRAVNVGIAAALARLHLHSRHAQTQVSATDPASKSDDDELTAALNKLNISQPGPSTSNIVKSTASVDILNNPAVKFIHGDIERDVYLENLIKWAKESRDAIARGESEIPTGLSQGDLYLCPGSLDAIQGALGTVCEAVDAVVSAQTPDAARRAFVAVRPPGHHCGENTPSGFCFVNNVAVAAAHAHLKHGINRVVIFDIDLHHGNGTQSIVWQINEETYRNTLEASYGSTSAKPGPQMYYGSIHDVLSYPCEDGKPDLVQAASTSIHGPHGQYIENIHLQTYSSNEEFFEELYSKRYSKLLSKAEEFLNKTGGPGNDVLVFISCGFDACEHEYESMQRHQRRVPTTFYHRFAKDACVFADRYARGRVVSVLEGGYSDRALISGAMAHAVGLAGVDGSADVEAWWAVDNLTQLEEASKKRRGGRPSQTQSQQIQPEWIQRTLEIFSTIDLNPPVVKTVVPASSMSLRDRSNKPLPTSSSSTAPSAPSTTKSKRAPAAAKKKVGPGALTSSGSEEERHSPPSSGEVKEGSKDQGMTESASVKKLPKVILRLGPRDGSSVS